MTNEFQTYLRDWIRDDHNLCTWAKPDPDWFIQCVKNAIVKDRKLVVGVVGKAGSGKDSALKFFQEVGSYTWVGQWAFANPLKKIAEIMGFTKEQLVDRKLKETVDEFWGISPRKFLQMCGTEMFRDVWREDVWIKLATRDIQKLLTTRDIVFVTDVRFPNEAKAIKEMGGIIVRVERPGFENGVDPNHPSEKLVDTIPYDLKIENTAKDANAWAMKFAKELAMNFKKDAFYY